MAEQAPNRGRYAAFAARGIDFSKDMAPARPPKNESSLDPEQIRKMDAESLEKQLEEEKEKVAKLEELLERSRVENESVRQALESDLTAARKDTENARTQGVANAEGLKKSQNECQQLHEQLKKKSLEVEEMAFDCKLIENLASLITTHLESFAKELADSEDVQFGAEHRATVDDVLIAQDGMFFWRSLNAALQKNFCEGPNQNAENLASSSEARKQVEVLEGKVASLQSEVESLLEQREAVNNYTKERGKQVKDMKLKLENFLREAVLDSLHNQSMIRDSLSEALLFICRGERGGLRLNELAEGFRNARTALLYLADHYKIDHIHDQIRNLPRHGAGALTLNIDSIIFAYQFAEEDARKTGFRLTRTAVDTALSAQMSALETCLTTLAQMNLPAKDKTKLLENIERIVEAHRRLPEPKRHEITAFQAPHTWPSVQIPNLSSVIRKNLTIPDADRVVGITCDTISLRKADGNLEFWKVSKN